jgi:hypothetical protein
MPRRHVMTELMDKDQQHKPGGIPPAEDETIGHHRQQHGAARHRDFS